MRKRLFVTFLVCATLLAMGLSGCATTAPEESPTPVPDDSTAPTSPDTEPVNLTVWTGSWNEELLTELVATFNQTYPDITITGEYYPWDGMEDKYLVALQADNGPDILDMAVAWTIPFATMGKLQALNTYIEDAGVDLSDYYDGPMQTLTIDGSYYALPYRSESVALFYNKKLFREAGLDPEQPPTTWAELAEDAKTLTKGDVAGFGMSGKNAGNLTVQVYSIMFANGAKLLSDDMTQAAFNTPEGLEALELWSNMALVDKSVPASVLENDNTVNRNLFAQEKIAMYMSGNYDIDPILEANPDIEMGFAILPKMKVNATQIGGWNMGMTNTCQNPKEGFDFVNFMCSTEIAPLFSSTFPASRSAMENEKYSDPNLTAFKEAIEYAVPLPGSPRMTEITNIIYNESQAVIAGTKDAATALQDAEDQVNQLLSE